MRYYPVLITTLNRYEHFRRCVESLARCTHADRTELVIGLDYPPAEKYVSGYRQIKDYLPSITGFAKVTVMERDHNYGAIRNCRSLIAYSSQYYDACILSEDDNEFAPAFLDFMNKALDMYKDDDRVKTVGGYCHLEFDGLADKGVHFTYDNCAWGVGLWSHKEQVSRSWQDYLWLWKSPRDFWRIFSVNPSVAKMFDTMMHKKAYWSDIVRTVANIHAGTYQVVPVRTLVRNHGYDGSGIHCDTRHARRLAGQSFYEGSTYQIGSQPVALTIPRRVFFFCQLPDNRLKAWLLVVRKLVTILIYKVYCPFGKNSGQ